ncbi:MAG: ATP-binding cassette domain-containing protein [Streptosporangiales bacterium]|nr:ATP-binding cassette domain-containing protein [Streptosporangiales bacterium]
MTLEVQDLRAAYGSIEVLHGVSLSVDAARFGVVLGPNGAGKSTLLLALAGLVRVPAGTVTFEGERLHELPAHARVRHGIGLVSEQLNLFPNMSIRENLLVGGFHAPRNDLARRLDTVHELFPWLAERGTQAAGTLSGGQRKMLALGRALMGDPRLLLVDEPSSGLAPTIVTTVFTALRELHRRGLTVLLVEQHVQQSLGLADHAWVLEGGVLRLEGTADELRDNPYGREAYLGV